MKAPTHGLVYRKDAFTLVETMIAFFLFAIVAVAISAMVVHSQKIAEANIVKNTAHSIVQGYLEQIKVMSRGGIVSAIASGNPLSVTTVSSSPIGQVTTSDTLYLNQANSKQILYRLNPDSSTQVLNITITPTVVDLKTPSNGANAIDAFSVVLDYTYDIRDLRGVSTASGSVRSVVTSI